jgi:hypothetical protein
MALWGQSKEEKAAEARLIAGFYGAAIAAAESYDTAMNRVEDEAGDVYKLFGKLRATHLDYADDFKKRAKKLGLDPDLAGDLGATSGRIIGRVQGAGSIRDLLIAMRQGEENGVAMARETLEESNLSGKSESMIESYNRMHIDAIRDLSEQIALRGTYAGTSVELYSPQWLRYPKAGFWLLEGAVLLVGYLFGRGGRNQSASSSNGKHISQQQHNTSPRSKLDQSKEQYDDQIGREVGTS